MPDSLLPVPQDWKDRAYIDAHTYAEMYARAERDPDGFWRDEARRIDWVKPFTRVKNVSWDPDNFFIKWFEDGTLNVSANCIDRHLPGAPGRRPSCGKATTRTSRAPSPIRSCTTKSAASPMC